MLALQPPYVLDPKKKYTWEEICDIWIKAWCGGEEGARLYKEKGIITFKKEPKHRYPRTSVKGRCPIYFEHFIDTGKKLEEVTKEMGIKWDTSWYTPLPQWRPCITYQKKKPNELYVVNFKVPIHTHSYTSYNPLLVDISERHPWVYKIAISSKAAAERGIKDGDRIVVESEVGRVEGIAHVTEALHPEVVAIPGCLGAWAKSSGVGLGKGVHWNTLIPQKPETLDIMAATIDHCTNVKVYKLE